MKSLWDREAREGLMRRLDRLEPSTRAQWGRMTAGEMVAHVIQGMRLGSGELPSPRRRTVFGHWPFKYLFIYWIAFPRGAPAPREIVTRGKPFDWDANLVVLRELAGAFAALEQKRDWPLHPIFGRLSPRAWGALGWRHLDHHLRQFGL